MTGQCRPVLNQRLMYHGIYAPWDHYPKHLRFGEMQNPLIVLIEFFSWDWPDNHRKHLKVWRQFIISHERYRHDPYDASDLLHVYEMHLKLLEALYVLLLEYRDNRYALSEKDRPTQDQLIDEKEQWFYFPASLTDEELLNPYALLEKLFDSMSLPEYRDHLQDWLHAALSAHAIDEAIEAREIITVYENLKKMYSVAWLIHQWETTRTHFKKDKQEQEPQSEQYTHLTTSNPINDNINPLTPSHSETDTEPISENDKPEVILDIGKYQSIKPTQAERLGLEELKKMIIKLIGSVKMIWLLGIHRDPFTYYLLVLIGEEERSPEHEIVNRIEKHCRPFSPVFVMVHKLSVAGEGIKNGARFWNRVVHYAYPVYTMPSVTLPEANMISEAVKQERVKQNWERWGVQGELFLKGAGRYLADGDHAIALFLLHQAAESSLIGIIKAVLGYRLQVHNLSRMVKLTLLFTDGIRDSLQLDHAENVQLFELLQSAYARSRYEPGFSVDNVSVRMILQMVRRLLACIQRTYNERLN